MAETNTTRRARDDALITRALKALERRMRELESRYSITGECAARIDQPNCAIAFTGEIK